MKVDREVFDKIANMVIDIIENASELTETCEKNPNQTGVLFRPEDILRRYRDAPKIITGNAGTRNKGTYHCVKDVVTLYPRYDCVSDEEYYYLLFFLLVVSTSHKNRLGRDTTRMRGRYEPILSDIGAEALCVYTGIHSTQIATQRVASHFRWCLQTMIYERGTILEATKEAEKAVDHIIDMQQEYIRVTIKGGQNKNSNATDTTATFAVF